MKVLICNDLGCIYRLNNGQLEFAPMLKNGNYTITDDDFNAVEPELVGEEQVYFKDDVTTLYEVFKQVTKELK